MAQPLSDDASWIVIRARPAKELTVAAYLRQRGHTPYVPRLWNPKRQLRQPLFPGYLFARLLGPAFVFLFNLPGCLGPIMGARPYAEAEATNLRQPASVIPEIIDALRARENAHGNIELPERAALVRGDQVKLLAGPFAGQLGIFQEQTSRERVAVLFQLFGRPTRMQVRSELVERAA